METKSKILLIEDEESLAKGLEYNLISEGYEVDWAENGKSGLEKFKSVEFDLIILDIMLPFIDGFEVARSIREVDPQMPILILTARASTKDKVAGLELGADDYMTKPFNLDELLLRIKAMLRRKAWYKSVSDTIPLFTFGKNKIDFQKLVGENKGKEILLTQKEAMVLRYLVERKNEVVTRKELLENVWQTNPEIETRTVDNFIVRLRKYFEEDPGHPIYIKSVRSVGYMFSLD